MALNRDNAGVSTETLQQARLNLESMLRLNAACLALLVVVDPSGDCDEELVITNTGNLVIEDS